MSTFFTILTKVGEAKLANATALGQTVKFAKLAIGDGNGQLPTPNQNQTVLVRELRREPLNLIDVDDQNPNWIICEQVIPENVGGWTIREVGIYDVDGDLIAVGNFPETYKPVLSEGSGRTQTIRVVLQVSSTASVELKIDPSVVLATRKYVDDLHNSLVTAVDPFPQYAGKEKFRFSFHFQRMAILLVPYAESGNKLGKSFVSGRMTFARGAEQYSERLMDIELSIKSSYHSTNFTMLKYREDWPLRFCVLEYEGEQWLALYDDSLSGNAQDADVTFVGQRGVFTAGYTPEYQFKVITYDSSEPVTAPPTNPEVKETIVSLASSNVKDASGKQYYSESFPPLIEKIPDLSSQLSGLSTSINTLSQQTTASIDGLAQQTAADIDALDQETTLGLNSVNHKADSKLPLDVLVGSVVEFSTNQPRSGYVKAQRIELSRSAYPKLWAVVQNASNLTAQAVIDADPKTYAAHYGTGNGTTTFTTPDYHLGHFRRGAKNGVAFGQTEGHAVEYHYHNLPTGTGASEYNFEVYGIPDLMPDGTRIWNKYDSLNPWPINGHIAVTDDVGYISGNDTGQIVGNWANETRPDTINTYVYIFHGEVAV
ncbi:phage tail protein [Photobacterium galatheae]|uniref:Phage tail fibre protein N-terminal domain-containing protein n=1 Tax=Photobacterium galatheae TaxID=1654360 RepID=A0A066RYY3_9GAMM|nr:phage tail protein [Photobacterium galatheae]KDM92902.1 hypothetical protein EA58_03865 [Photobacterium galatheae]MCM0148133.1 phage tail protein [Photobacterium galatheae]